MTMSWEDLSVAAAELAETPISEARVRAAFVGADEEWKRTAALAFGAAAAQRAAEAALVLAAVAGRLACVGVYSRSDADELLAMARRLREQAAAASELAQRRLQRVAESEATWRDGRPEPTRPPAPPPGPRDLLTRLVPFPPGK